MASTYSWTATAGGMWSAADSWVDLTSGSDPAASAPAAGEVALFGTGNGAIVTGPGTAGLASLLGDWTLDGTFRFTALVADGGAGAGVHVAAGSTLALGTATLAGAIVLDGASLTATSLALAGAALAVQGGASLEAGTAGLGDATISVDGSSRIEIGNFGTGAAGTLTVDSGLRVAGHGFSLVAAIDNDGTIATDGSATIQGTVGGAGVLEVAAGASLRLDGSAAEGQRIRLLGAGTTLDLSSGTVSGLIEGFQSGAVIRVPGAVDGVNYVPDLAGTALDGWLDLTAGGTLVARLDLRGDYAGQGFGLTPTGGALALSTDAPAGRVLQWNATAGTWQDPVNWTDVTATPSAALSAPGGNDVVEIVASGTAVAVFGPGTAAVLGVDGDVAFDGTFTAGTLEVRPHDPAIPAVARLSAGTLMMADHVVVAGSLFLAGATMEVAGALALDVVGPAGDPFGIGDISLSAGAVMRVDTLDLGGYFGLSAILLGSLSIDASSVLEVGSAGGAAAGTLTVDTGHAVRLGADVTADIVNNGSLLVEGFAFVVPRLDGTVSGAGTIALGSALFSFGGGLVVAGGVGAGQTIGFGGPNQKLSLLAPESFAGTLTGFTSANTIALPGSITSGNFTPGGSGGVLSLFAGTDPAGSLTFAGDFAGAGFNLAFANGEAILSTDVPCFAAGTRIATVAGEVPVEALRPGDLVLTPWGEALPVRWLGHRRVDCWGHARPHDVLPVRILAGAFGPGLPARDLRLSPDHAIFSDGALVPARYLLNGATVMQEQVPSVAYWHVELERHDVLLAEGLCCESYLDTGNRSAFANGGQVRMLHPAFGSSAWEHHACGRLVTEGPVLAALRSRLFARALGLGFRLCREPASSVTWRGQAVAGRSRGGWHLFRLPGVGTGPERLCSRSMAPGELWLGNIDHRRLGIAVARLRIDGAELPLDDPRLGAGWHAPEPGLRWTTGAAEIDLFGVRRLAVQVLPLLEYWEPPIGEAPVSPAARSGSLRLRA